MIVKNHNRKTYFMQIESLNDLATLKFLLESCRLIFFEKRKYKSENSKKVKIFHQKIELQDLDLIVFNKNKNLEVQGHNKGKIIKKILRIGSKFFLIKKFSKKQKNLINNLTPLKTLYLGVGDSLIEWGTVVDYNYKVEQRRNYNIDNLRFVVYQILDQLKFHPTKIREYRCCQSFISLLKSWTGLDWKPLERDVMLEGHYLTKKQIAEQKFIEEILDLKRYWVRDKTEFEKEFERYNIRVVYFQGDIDYKLYSAVVDRKIPYVLLPFTEGINSVLKNSFLGLKFFEFPE